MSKESRVVVTPVTCFSHDDEEYCIEVELPGVNKGHIEVTVAERGLCVAGSKENLEYAGCWYLVHEIDENKAKAKYENGLLTVTIPFKEMPKGRNVPVE